MAREESLASFIEGHFMGAAVGHGVPFEFGCAKSRPVSWPGLFSATGADKVVSSGVTNTPING
jgi:hypothetical protein